MDSSDSKMEEMSRVDYEYLEEIPGLYGCIITLVSYIVFRYLNNVVRDHLTGEIIPDKERWKWRNIFVSVIHSWMAAVWVIYCFYYYPELFVDPVAFHNWSMYLLITISLGYFLADFMDIILSRKSKENWEVLVHHVVVIYIVLYNACQCRYVGANVVSLAVEVNSVFLHTRKLMQLCKVDFSTFHYRSVVALNVLTFLGFRFPAIGYITYAGIMHHHRMTTLYAWLLAIMIFFTWIINFGLFYRVIKSDYLRKPKRKEILTNGGQTNGLKHSVNGEERGLKKRNVNNNSL